MFLCIQLACIKVLGVDPYLHICSYFLQDLSPVPAVAWSEQVTDLALESCQGL